MKRKTIGTIALIGALMVLMTVGVIAKTSDTEWFTINGNLKVQAPGNTYIDGDADFKGDIIYDGAPTDTGNILVIGEEDVISQMDLSGTYTDNSAYVCVNNAGVIFVSETGC